MNQVKKLVARLCRFDICDKTMKNMIKTTRLIGVILGVFLCNICVSGQGHHIEITIDNYENDTLVTGYYFADRQLVHDTLISDSGVFTLKGDSPLSPGMYLAITKPKNDYIQFMVNEKDQEFSIESDYEDLRDLSADGSVDNELFFDYLSYIGEQSKKANMLNQMATASENGVGNMDEIKKQQKELNADVVAYQKELVDNNPETITARLIKSNMEIRVPDIDEADPQLLESKKYYYYKNHFFDNIDLSDSINLRTPFFDNRVQTFLDKITTQIPDTIIKSVDVVLGKMENNPPAFKFYLSTLLGKYGRSKIVGMDAIYVHIIDKYYAQGKAPWVAEETLVKLKDNARKMSPALIGKTGMNIKTRKQDSTEVSLYDIESDYTVLYFFSHTCGHCKKSTPSLVEFANKFPEVTVMSVCTKRDIENCWKYNEEYMMDNIINTVDPFQQSGFAVKYHVTETPRIYILDKKKKILMKNFPTEELENIMDEIIKIEEQRKLKEHGGSK